MNKKSFLFLIVFLIAAGCSSGSRFSKEVLLSNIRISSIDNTISSLIPNYWKNYEDNLNQTILLWFVNNSGNSSILITEVNSNAEELSTLAEITKASKKQNKENFKISSTQSFSSEDKTGLYFLMEGKTIQYVFLFKHKNRVYEASSISHQNSDHLKEELFYITKEVIGSIK